MANSRKLPRWSIVILTLPVRHRFLERLLGILKPQLEGYPDIQLLMRQHVDRGIGYGDAIEVVRREASGKYICMIDDDDCVAPDYISRIYPVLDGTIDYVGFKLRWSCDGQRHKPWIHSLKNPALRVDAGAVLRDISHLNPMRRELAMRVPFSGGLDADQRWSAGIRALGIVRTEVFIDRELYSYEQVSAIRREEYFATATPPEVTF